MPESRVLVVALVAWASTASAERTLWLVRPLYPGQEALVGRTEQALNKLIPPAARANEVIGVKELSAALKGKKLDEVPCLSSAARCSEPIDAFVAGLNFDRVVLVKAGQDEGGFKFSVVSLKPATHEVAPATAVHAVLENALLGAVAKVAPVASSLDLRTTPPGATVYIDDIKVGVTPLSTQVLPGERVIRLDLKLHQPVEETLLIPVRGSAKLDKALEKVAARIVVTASPAGASISIDGQVLGKDRVDRGIAPGKHSVRITADNYKAYEQSIEVKSDEQLVLDKSLEPVPGFVVVDSKGRNRPELPLPPSPPTETELTYEKKAYFHFGFEWGQLTGNAIVGRRWGTAGIGRTEGLATPGRALIGATGEYGLFGKYFGLAVVGLTYFTNPDRWDFNVGHSKDSSDLEFAPPEGALLPQAKVHLVTLRALQPQFRLSVWKFMFSLQAGLEFRSGQISGQPASPYKDGFMPLDLLASGRFSTRFFIVEGLYFLAAFNYAHFLFGEVTFADVRSVGSLGFTVGAGYGF